MCILKPPGRDSLFPRSPVRQAPQSGREGSAPPPRPRLARSPCPLSAPRRPRPSECRCVRHVAVCAPVSVRVFSHSVVSGSVTPRPVARQAPLSAGFSRQEDWSGSPFLPPGQRPTPGMEVASPASPALRADSFPWPLWKATRSLEGRWFQFSWVSQLLYCDHSPKPPIQTVCRAKLRLIHFTC